VNHELQICLRCNAMIPRGKKACPKCHMTFEPVVGPDHFINNRFPIDDGLYLLDGTLIGERYQIAGFLGKGRHGKVYLANDLLHSRQVVLKIKVVVPGEYDSRALPNENHPFQRIEDTSHVIRIFDSRFVPWEGAKLMVVSMEHADGGTFRAWLKSHQDKPKIRATTGLEVFKQACKGFAALHQADIVHCNVTPENLLFVNGRLKVTDYFPVTIRTVKMEDNGNFNINFESLPGRPVYMSPEQFIASDPEKIDKRSDIYSLGMILFELLDPKGQPPFSGNYARLRELHLEVRPSIDPGVDEELKAIISRCLAKDPGRRYQAVDDLIADLTVTPHKGSASTQSQETVDNHKLTSLEGLWDRARHCYTQGDFKETAVILDEILSVEPTYDSARELKTELQHRFVQAQKIYHEITLNIEINLDAAPALLKEAATLYPNHPEGYEIQTKLEYRLSCYRRAMEEGSHALQRAHLETALAWFRSAFEMNPGDQSLKSLIGPLTEIEMLRKQINLALQQGDLDRARYLAHLIDIETEEILPNLSS